VADRPEIDRLLLSETCVKGASSSTLQMQAKPTTVVGALAFQKLVLAPPSSVIAQTMNAPTGSVIFVWKWGKKVVAASVQHPLIFTLR
jgi:hypothetical protein